MADIQRVEVDSHAGLVFDALTFADFARGHAAVPDPCMRVYAREHALKPTIVFVSAMQRFLARLTQPHSRMRVLMESQLQRAPETPHWFIYDAARSRLHAVDAHDGLQQALATLRAARDIRRNGDVVVEVVNAQQLLDQVWRELEITVAPATMPAVEVDAVPALAYPAPMVAKARPTPAAAARQLREAFLDRGWPTSVAVGERLGANNPAQRAAELRAAGRLLGAWSARQRTYVHPECQFDDHGEPLPVVRELLRQLPVAGDDGGWRRVFWLCGPRDALDGRAPADLLASDPGRVLALAQAEFLAAPGTPAHGGV